VVNIAPWKCPDCGTWCGPGVTEHRCPDEGGGLSAVTGGGGGGTWPGSVTIAPTTTVVRPPTIWVTGGNVTTHDLTQAAAGGLPPAMIYHYGTSGSAA
jgi:hypothetical protein